MENTQTKQNDGLLAHAHRNGPVPRFRGLTALEVTESRKKNGINVLTAPPRDPLWKQFLEKFDDPVIRILMIAAVIAIAAGSIHGDFLEGIGIISAVLLATGLAFFNEYKANREFDILNKVNDETPVKVIRTGGHTSVPIMDIVVGDIVFVESGEDVPADGMLLEAVSLQVVESALTGEAEPNCKFVRENENHTTASTIPADRMLRGTKVVDGHGLFEVTAVGDSTDFGKTARSGIEETGEVTPLKEQLERLSKVIGVVGLAIAVLTFVALIFRGTVSGELSLTGQQWFAAGIFAVGASISLLLVWLPMVLDGFELAGGWLGKVVKAPGFLGGDDGPSLKTWFTVVFSGLFFTALGLGIGSLTGLIPMSPNEWLPEGAMAEFLKYFMIAVTIIVVAVPEGLAMSVTLSLAYSMRKMTASNTLVRKMDACETIGATTVICSDKTGTLTMNEMRVFETQFFGLSSKTLNAQNDKESMLVAESISANTTAHLDRTNPLKPLPLGNPTEGALLLWLHENSQDYVLLRDEFKVIVQLTFSTERKFMATMGLSPGHGHVIHVKGAPEVVLGRCSNIIGPDGARSIEGELQALTQTLRSYQARGMRTLGFAFKKLGDASNSIPTDLEADVSGLTWLGFAAIADPIRPEVPAAIKACREAGIRVKMVTGDSQDTAEEIARQIGLCDRNSGPNARAHGPEFANLSEAEAEETSNRIFILSRARPLDKVRLVKSLQARGEIVAVTGDGINDCGALNYANVGLAMGRTGKAAAKEASDIILLDDSFGTIINAVMWGRSLYENIQRFILFQLTINVAALGVAFLGPFIGVKLPLTVIQMLWVNLIMDTFAALALATEPPHPNVLKRPPRDPKTFIITKPMAVGIFGVGGIFLAVLVSLLLYMQRDGIVTDHELSIFFSIFVMLQFWNLFNARCLGRNHSALHGLLANRSFILIAAAIFIGQVLLIQYGGSVFRTVPLSLWDWLLIVAATSPVLLLGEIWRFIGRLKTARAS